VTSSQAELAIHRQPSGDVDIAVPTEDTDSGTALTDRLSVSAEPGE
jgi:hypothetical protein